MDQSSQRVVIAGAGPTGLSCALQLVRAGVPVLVLERENGLPMDMRASTFHPATLDLLHESGLAGRLIEQGSQAPRWQYLQHGSGDAIVFDLALLADATRYPFRLQCEQFRYTHLVVDELRDNPLFELRRGAQVTDVQARSNGVEVTWEEGGASHGCDTPWLIAADGGKSTLRGLLELPFEGSVFPKTSITLVLDHPFQEQRPELLGVNYVWTDTAHYSLMQVRDQWRFSYSPRPEQEVHEALSEKQAQATLQTVFPRKAEYRILQRNYYTLHQRSLDSFRHGRILFAGDAAHLNSPSGGMGMNSGIHDAFCLVEHLLPVLNGAPETILDRYDRRRRHIAQAEVQRLSARNYRLHRETDPGRRAEIWAGLDAIANDPERAREYLMDSSMLNSLGKEKEIQ